MYSKLTSEAMTLGNGASRGHFFPVDFPVVGAPAGNRPKLGWIPTVWACPYLTKRYGIMFGP
jgi:hypothetical protein